MTGKLPINDVVERSFTRRKARMWTSRKVERMVLDGR